MTRTVFGRYEIKGELGRGGMATVYHAFDPRFRRDVALKILPREFLHDQTFRARFEREAQSIAGLEHSAIVPVHDFGEEEDQPFLVMRFMPGGSLADRIQQGPLSLGEITPIMDRICAALDFAHSKDIIHRDVKPANILFDEPGDPYLSDFGIVKVAETTAQLTGSGIVGTPAYMAPEMARRGGITPLIDVYALTVTLYQMLTGQLPYDAETPMGLLMAHLGEPIPDARDLRPDLSGAVQAVVERGMAKDPGERYASAGELAAALHATEMPPETIPLPPRPRARQVTEAEPATEPMAEAITPPDDVVRLPTVPEEPTAPEEPAAVAEPVRAERPARRRGLPGCVWAIGGGLTAVVVLVGVLAAAGVIDFGGGAPAEPEYEAPPAEEEAAPAEEVAPEEAIPAEEEEAKLEIFHWWAGPGEREAADAMFAALAEWYPEIEVIENPGAGDGVSNRDTLETRLAAGVPPDTFQARGGAQLRAYVDGGVLEPLDYLWDELGYYDVVPRPLADVVSVDGHPYAVPLNMHLQNVLYYNQVWFDEQGLEPPRNFDELIFACQVFYETGYTDYPMGLGTQGDWEASFVLDSILLELGGPEYYVSLYKGEIDVTTDDTYREALERLAALYQYTNPDHPALWWDESLDRVVSGDSAMVIMGTWAIGALTSWSWEPGADYGAVIFPQEPERILLFHPDTFDLAAGAPHPISTKKWLELVASPDLQIPTNVTQGSLFARIDIDPTEFPDPFRQEMQQFVRDNPGSLVLDQHGSIAPLDFSYEYWVIIADFMADPDPDVDATVAAVASVFEAHDVKNRAAWYTWP